MEKRREINDEEDQDRMMLDWMTVYTVMESLEKRPNSEKSCDFVHVHNENLSMRLRTRRTFEVTQ